MKKIMSLLLVAVMALGFAACSATSQNKPAEEKTDKEITVQNSDSTHEENEEKTVTDAGGNNVLVVYFSVTGNTKSVAEKIASVTDADIYEIKPVVEYTDADINYNDVNSRTSKEQNDASARPQILGENISLDGYETIYIGYPIWWGEEPRILDTFVESYDFGSITMVPFCTSASSGVGKSDKNLAEHAANGNWLAGKRFTANASENEIKDWINGLQ